ncbi:MAG: sensor domain-containing diguanylate cyclase [Gammaproteobacteria bacterium]|nr:sensor domain-containing diguanylate cyclase [Gammaproteobacteria bacterium]
MTATPEPIGETHRLCSLQNLKVLDTLPGERFGRITSLVARVFDVPVALVNLTDESLKWFNLDQDSDAPESESATVFCNKTIRAEDAFVVSDTQADPQFSSKPCVVGGLKVRSYAGFPVHASDGACVGTLCVMDERPRQFSEDHIANLRSFAEMVDRELALLTQTTSDELTRLMNRRGFIQIAEHMLALCQRNEKPATLIGIDLDNFKTINDTHGHDAGDRVLKRFAALLVKNFRASDIVSRFGGDEFCILSSYSTRETIRSSLARLGEAFASSEIAEEFPKLSYSAGIAEYEPVAKPDLDSLLQQADTRMYAAKQAMREKRG